MTSARSHLQQLNGNKNGEIPLTAPKTGRLQNTLNNKDLEIQAAAIARSVLLCFFAQNAKSCH